MTGSIGRKNICVPKKKNNDDEFDAITMKKYYEN